MRCTVKDIKNIIEDLAPVELAEQWDNVGLILGNVNAPATRIMVCLDVTRPLIIEALSKGVDMIVSHHPLLFEPVKSIRTDSYPGQIIYPLIREGIAVYCAHTNLDKAEYGTDYALAERLGLHDISSLTFQSDKGNHYKIVVFTPESHEQAVLEAMCQAGAGQIGNYSHCTFQVPGTGTFTPMEGSTPYSGEMGKLKRAKEVRLETIVQRDKLNHVVEEMKKVHPYEEPAYDIYHLDNPVKKSGFGRIGKLPNKTQLKEYIKQIYTHLSVDSLEVIGDLDNEVQIVAVCGGSGGSLAAEAYARGADLFITGEIKYHQAQSIVDMGMSAVIAGHFFTEAPLMFQLTQRLQMAVSALQYEVDIFTPDTVTNPFFTVSK